VDHLLYDNCNVVGIERQQPSTFLSWAIEGKKMATLKTAQLRQKERFSCSFFSKCIIDFLKLFLN